jgi:SRSO17 transposase
MTESEIEQCRNRLEQFLVDLLEPQGRRERRHWSEVYIRGLLLDGERKSIEPMAARLPDGNVQAMQQLIGQSPWPWVPVWQRLARRMTAELMPDPVWVIDDTGFPKKGEHSVGVARQYSGTLGKTANCQVAVSLHQVGAEESTILDWRLYLPQSWTQDAERRAEAGIPEEMKFQTKWQLALDMIDEARGWGLPCGVVLADAGYGETTEFRQGLESRQLRYAVGIPSTVTVWTQPPRLRTTRGRSRRPTVYHYGQQRPCTVREVAAKARGWKRVRWREGTKAWLESRFYACRVQPAHDFDEGEPPLPEVWLLVEWPSGEPQPTKYFLCQLPEHYSLRRLVRIVKSRWKIEQDYQQLKEELGLDHYEGRNWTGWHHHVTLVMLAHAFLTLEMLRNKKNFWVDPATDAP